MDIRGAVDLLAVPEGQPKVPIFAQTQKKAKNLQENFHPPRHSHPNTSKKPSSKVGKQVPRHFKSYSPSRETVESLQASLGNVECRTNHGGAQYKPTILLGAATLSYD